MAIHPREPQQHNVLKFKAYNFVKSRIVNCQYLPGMLLSEQALAEEMAMSRTPVREALALLSQESLVRVVPRRGAFVAELSLRDIDEIFELREAIECWVMRKVAGKIPVEKLDEFAASLAEIDQVNETAYWRAISLDQEFHNYLVNFAGNNRCEQIYRNVADHNQRIRILSTRQPGRLIETVREHRLIIEALRSGEPEVAASAMQRHIDNARQAALRLE
ncbi:MAG: GntR family transcriptional regulator [Syntrophothermus sp.]